MMFGDECVKKNKQAFVWIQNAALIVTGILLFIFVVSRVKSDDDSNEKTSRTPASTTRVAVSQPKVIPITKAWSTPIAAKVAHDINWVVQELDVPFDSRINGKKVYHHPARTNLVERARIQETIHYFEVRIATNTTVNHANVEVVFRPHRFY